MATYYVNSAAAGTNSGANWTNAYTAFGSAVTAATASGDVIKVHYTHQENLAANATYTFANHVNVVSVDKDASDAQTAMAEGGWIGSNSAGRAITLAGAFKVYLFGVTFRFHGSAGLTVNNTDGGHFELESCKLWNSITSNSANHILGNTGNSFCRFVDCDFKSARTSGVGDAILFRGNSEFYGCTFVWATTVTGGLFTVSTTSSLDVRFSGCDFSGLQASTTYFGNNATCASIYTMERCKLSTSPTLLASQTSAPNRGSARLTVLDCESGDTHLAYQYHDAFGSLVLNTSVYFTTTTYSWKIDTTANCSYFTPFVAPIFGVYHSGASAITPYVEILRDGSTTAYQNDEVWLQAGAKTTPGSTIATLSADRCTLANKLAGTLADQAAGAGTGSWTGEGGTAWSGKIDSGSSLTPAEVGDISAQVCVGEPSITVYVDPVIRT